MKTNELIKLIEVAGWVFVRQSGSHRIYKHPNHENLITIPFHGSSKDLKKV